MRKIRLRITQRDIDNGRRMSVGFCPIALSLKRRGFHEAGVGGNIWFPASSRECFPLSVQAMNFVDDFDNRLKVKPLWLTLEYR